MKLCHPDLTPQISFLPHAALAALSPSETECKPGSLGCQLLRRYLNLGQAASEGRTDRNFACATIDCDWPPRSAPSQSIRELAGGSLSVGLRVTGRLLGPPRIDCRPSARRCRSLPRNRGLEIERVEEHDVHQIRARLVAAEVLAVGYTLMVAAKDDRGCECSFRHATCERTTVARGATRAP